MTQDIIDRFGNDPFVLFDQWFAEAEKSEINDPNAMFLSCINEEGQPTVRTVLLKGHDERGFVLYTNHESEKGRALLANPYAETLFYWKSTEKQIRIRGPIEEVHGQEADDYYNSRHRSSRIGAWASMQSRPMDTADDLKKREEDFHTKFEGQDDIPRPPNWAGFRIIPERIEFWIAGQYRLHTRFVYTRENAGDWHVNWLYP